MTTAPSRLTLTIGPETPENHSHERWIRIVGDCISETGQGLPPAEGGRGPSLRVRDVMPGLVDIHAHGAVGIDFSQLGTDPAPAIDYHRATGTTTIIASLATAPPEVLHTRLRELQPLVQEGVLGGLHLEGPWLSPLHRGAHAIRLLTLPTLREADSLLRAGGGAITMVTIAPELPGALSVIEFLVEAGVTVALGHTAADADAVRAGLDVGATVMTHLFNGMPALHHRLLGPVGIGLTDPRIVLELVADGVHVDDSLIDMVLTLAGDRVALISDAMAATGLVDGDFEVAGSAVTVVNGAAYTTDRSLAGSTHTLGGSVQRLYARGVPIAALSRAASATPAAAVGFEEPLLKSGARADLVVIDHQGRFRTMWRGQWVDSSS